MSPILRNFWKRPYPWPWGLLPRNVFMLGRTGAQCLKFLASQFFVWRNIHFSLSYYDLATNSSHTHTHTEVRTYLTSVHIIHTGTVNTGSGFVPNNLKICCKWSPHSCKWSPSHMSIMSNLFDSSQCQNCLAMFQSTVSVSLHYKNVNCSSENLLLNILNIACSTHKWSL